MNQLRSSLLNQIDDALKFSDTLRDEEGNYMSSVSAYETFITLALAAITRATGPDSVYLVEASQTADRRNSQRRIDWSRITGTLVGALQAVREAIKKGYLDSVFDIVHAGVFADFLEMSQHLLDKGYKDAAAVIAGSSLEGQLRHLSRKSGVPDIASSGKPKTADRLNADLSKANAYDTLNQKNITAWLDLRNKAAHGKYEEYSPEMVGNMISGIRHFITSNSP